MLKRFLPKTLFGRFLTIIITPIIILQTLSIYLFYERHWDRVSRRLAYTVAADVGLTLNLLETYPDRLNQLYTLPGYRYLDMDAAFLPGETFTPATPEEDSVEGLLYEELKHLIPRQDFQIRRAYFADEVVITLPYQNGILEFRVRDKRLFSSTTYIFIMWITGMAMILFAIAIVFMKNQIRPIRQLSRAADVLGRGGDIQEIKPSGAREVRQAALAFKRMRDRIQRNVQQRTDMLSGVSHDLRTPLTRMKLQLNLMPDSEARDNLLLDIQDMEKMVEAYLNFARGEGNEKLQKTNITKLIEKIVSQHLRQGHRVEFHHSGKPVRVEVKPTTLTRAVANVLSNAIRYGERAVVTLARDDNNLTIIIDDNGPGIPVESYEDVFKPFYRLETSRNQVTGGVGLGLPIARDAIRAHGGDIRLAPSKMGGLQATLRIPL